MPKNFEKFAKAAGGAIDAVGRLEGVKKVERRADELMDKVHGISEKLERNDPRALAEASAEVEELMKSQEGQKSASILKELHLKTMLKTVEFFHEHPKALKGVRKVWDAMPKAAQDAMLASRFVSATQLPGNLLNSLTYAGLLETPEAERKARMKNDVLLLKGAGALATALGYGEAAAPLVGLEVSALDAMSENYDLARKHLKDLEAQSAAKQAETAAVKKLKAEEAKESSAHVAAARRKILGGVKGRSEDRV